MKKLIAIVITLIFIFDGTGHCLATDALRPQLLCQKGAGVKKTTASNQFRIGKVEVINPEALKAINIKHAVFDYDGTIDVSLEGLWQETEASFMLLTRETANSIVNKTLGMHTFERMKIAVKEAHPRWDDYRVSIIARLLENQAKEEMYVKWRAAYWTKDTALVPGVTGVLEAFSKTGIICHVATADYVKNKIKMADRFGILEYFGKNGERIHGDGDERYEGKEEFLRSLITGEIKANQIVMFGDSLSDIKAAKSAGCIAIGIAKDNKLREEFIEAGTDIVIHGNCRNIREILAVLKVKQYTQADLEKIERVEIAIRSMEHGDRLLDVVSGLIGIDINLAVLEKLIYKTGPVIKIYKRNYSKFIVMLKTI